MAEATSDDGTVGRSTWIAIGAMSLAVFAIANDFTAMNVALPAIEAELDTDLATAQWVVSGYALLFGCLIVPGGRLADIYGRRRILFLGAAIFAAFSLLGGLAPSIGLLIAARVLMGVGGAMMWPAILGLIYALLPASKAGLAGGLVIGVAGIGNATGPVIAGALSEVSWRYVFFLNVPIACIAILVTWRAVHVAEPDERESIDYLGTALLSVSLAALLGALTMAPAEGWSDPLVLGGLAVSAVVMAGFVLRTRSAGERSLVPPSVIANRPFLWACLSVLAMSATFFATLLYLPQFFQSILDEGTLASGLMLLPFVGVFAAASFAETWLLNRIGMKAVISIGAVCILAGPLLFVVLLDQTAGYARLVPGMVVLGAGVGLFYSSVTTAALTALDPSRSSLAGGLLYMFQVAGGAIGLGLTTAVFLTTANGEIGPAASELGIALTGSEVTDVQGVLTGRDTGAQLLAAFPEQATQLTGVVRDAFVRGVRFAFAFDAALALIGATIALLRVGGPLSRFGRDVGTDEEPGSGDEPGTDPADGAVAALREPVPDAEPQRLAEPVLAGGHHRRRHGHRHLP